MARQPRRQVTLKDIGDKLGISGRAVSQALSERPGTVRLNPATRERIRKLAARMGYRQNRAALTLRSGSSGMIGVLYHRAYHYLSLKQLHLAVDAIKAKGLRPFVYYANTWNPSDPSSEAVEVMLDNAVDGVLSYSFNQIEVDQLLKAGIAVCSLGRPGLKRVPKYFTDKRAAFHEAALHLVEQGCRSLVLLGGLPKSKLRTIGNHHLSELCYGFWDAEKTVRRRRHRVRFTVFEADNETYPVSSAPDIHPLCATGYLAMKQLIARGQLPEAVMCFVDNWAHGVLRACAEHDIEVPRDLAVVGFEDDPISSVGTIPLTSVAQPFEELTRLAVGELVDIVEGKRKPSSHSVKLPGRLLPRESSLRLA